MPKTSIKDSIETLISKAQSAISINDLKKASEFLTEALKMQPKNQKALTLMNQVLKNTKENQIRAGEKIRLASEKMDAGEAESALSLLSEAKEIFPDVDNEKVAYIQKMAFRLIRDIEDARILMETRDPQLALEKLEILANQFPQSDEIGDLRRHALRTSRIQSNMQGPTSLQYITAAAFVFVSIIFLLRWIGLL